MGATRYRCRAAAALLPVSLALAAGACGHDGRSAITGGPPASTASQSSVAATVPPASSRVPDAATSTAAQLPTPVQQPPQRGTPVPVPAFPSGTTVDEALAVLARRGLAAGVPAVAGLSTTYPGPVGISTRPVAGTTVASGSSVKLRFDMPLGSPSCLRGRAQVPDVVALPLGDAIAAVDEAHFAWHTSRLAALPADPARTSYLGSYTVVAQSPARGIRERCGVVVELTVRVTPAGGRTLVPRMPPLTSVERALLLLRRAGLVAETGPLGPVDSMADAIVRSTQPIAGASVPRGSTVVIALGLGLLGSPGCATVDVPKPVPDVVGLTLADAGRLARWTVDGGLPALRPDPDRTSYLASIVVTGQSPAAGSPGLSCAGPPLVLTVKPSTTAQQPTPVQQPPQPGEVVTSPPGSSGPTQEEDSEPLSLVGRSVRDLPPPTPEFLWRVVNEDGRNLDTTLDLRCGRHNLETVDGRVVTDSIECGA